MSFWCRHKYKTIATGSALLALPSIVNSQKSPKNKSSCRLNNQGNAETLTTDTCWKSDVNRQSYISLLMIILIPAMPQYSRATSLPVSYVLLQAISPSTGAQSPDCAVALSVRSSTVLFINSSYLRENILSYARLTFPQRSCWGYRASGFLLGVFWYSLHFLSQTFSS